MAKPIRHCLNIVTLSSIKNASKVTGELDLEVNTRNNQQLGIAGKDAFELRDFQSKSCLVLKYDHFRLAFCLCQNEHNQTYFHKKDFAGRLVLKQRQLRYM